MEPSDLCGGRAAQSIHPLDWWRLWTLKLRRIYVRAPPSWKRPRRLPPLAGARASGMKLIAWSGVVAGILYTGDVVRWLVPWPLVRRADAHMGDVVAMSKKHMTMAGDHGGDGIQSRARPPYFMTHILMHARRGLVSTDVSELADARHCRVRDHGHAAIGRRLLPLAR